MNAPMVLPPRRETPVPPPMTEDQLRQAMMADGAAKVMIGRGFRDETANEKYKTKAAEQAAKRFNSARTIANRVRAHLRKHGPSTAREISDAWNREYSSSQVSNVLSKMRHLGVGGVKTERKRGRLWLWELNE